MKNIIPLLFYISSLLGLIIWTGDVEGNIQIAIVAHLAFICGVLYSIKNKIKG